MTFLLDVDRSYATRFLSNAFLTGRLFVTPHRLPGATADSAVLGYYEPCRLMDGYCVSLRKAG